MASAGTTGLRSRGQVPAERSARRCAPRGAASLSGSACGGERVRRAATRARDDGRKRKMRGWTPRVRGCVTRAVGISSCSRAVSRLQAWDKEDPGRAHPRGSETPRPASALWAAHRGHGVHADAPDMGPTRGHEAATNQKARPCSCLECCARCARAAILTPGTPALWVGKTNHHRRIQECPSCVAGAGRCTDETEAVSGREAGGGMAALWPVNPRVCRHSREWD